MGLRLRPHSSRLNTPSSVQVLRITTSGLHLPHHYSPTLGRSTTHEPTNFFFFFLPAFTKECLPMFQPVLCRGVIVPKIRLKSAIRKNHVLAKFLSGISQLAKTPNCKLAKISGATRYSRWPDLTLTRLLSSRLSRFLTIT